MRLAISVITTLITLVVAHRGASAYAPENTIAAFELAAGQGADMFELDVRETSDHHLVLMHDPTLSRTTDVERVHPGRSPWRVGDFTLAEIRSLDAGSWFDGDYRGSRVPTLEEALESMSGSGLGLLLEIKEPGTEAAVAQVLRSHPYWLGGDRLVVQSFSWRSMRVFHRSLPEVPIGLLGTPAVRDLASLSAYADEINPPYADVTRDYVRKVHEHGMKVRAWTVDDPATMRRMISYGVDAIITNRPDLMP
ncbi:glycerophosphodiester phosphodiesterase [Nonomuraea sp. NPDC050556]|uniref:glycerophosphodiester phosphodiesterase n=1 Tax=Nonomuraea sp. NPDC050556 TaxID=3364369 RepID=UPI00378A7740